VDLRFIKAARSIEGTLMGAKAGLLRASDPAERYTGVERREANDIQTQNDELMVKWSDVGNTRNIIRLSRVRDDRLIH
jgi:hypothetical protein